MHHLDPNDVIFTGEFQFRNSAAWRTIFAPEREANVDDLPTIEHEGAIFVCAKRWRDVEEDCEKKRGREVVVHLGPYDSMEAWKRGILKLQHKREGLLLERCWNFNDKVSFVTLMLQLFFSSLNGY